MEENQDKLLCKKCGTANKIDHRFCAGCGSNLAAQARESERLKTSRLGCFGCFGIFLAIFAVILAGAFLYLRKDGVIYTDQNGNLTLTYVTIFAPMLSQGEGDHEPYKFDDPPKFVSDKGEIRFHFRYLAYMKSAKPQFVVRTSREIQTSAENEFPRLKEIYASSPSLEVRNGYDQGLSVSVFSEGAKPEAGWYVTEILVDRKAKGKTDRNRVIKRRIRFEVLSSR